MLFEIDPEDYTLALNQAKADLAILDQQIEVESPDTNLFRMGASAAAIIQGPPARE